jgi:hypothetical protein
MNGMRKHCLLLQFFERLLRIIVVHRPIVLEPAGTRR